MRPSQRRLASFWIFAGVMHFVVPRRYEAIVPSYIPMGAKEAVQASGVAEILGGLAVIPQRTRRPFARWWILGVLAAVFPANIWMATNPEEASAEDIPRILLWLRLPIQPLFAFWAWRATED